MKKPNDGGPAFPGTMITHNNVTGAYEERLVAGMTLRQWYAGKALPAVIAAWPLRMKDIRLTPPCDTPTN